MSADFAIVTAASGNHYQSLRQFLASVDLHEPDTTCYVYDLGLEPEQVKELSSFCAARRHFEVRTFDYARYPPWFDIHVDRGHFGWKPAIIKEVAERHRGKLLWCDAGNRLLAPLDRIRAFLDIGKIYSPLSSGTIGKWTHKECLAVFGLRGESPILNMPPRNGAILGFNLADSVARDFLNEFARLCGIKQCIAPAGSDSTNHRQDQAVFTLLYYSTAASLGLPTTSDYLDISIHNDVG